MGVPVEYIDVDDGLKRIMGNKTIYKKLLGSFKKDTYFDKLKLETNNGEYEAAAKTAHTIKGVSANLSFKKLNEITVSLEEDLKNGHSDAAKLGEMESILTETLHYADILIETL